MLGSSVRTVRSETSLDAFRSFQWFYFILLRNLHLLFESLATRSIMRKIESLLPSFHILFALSFLAIGLWIWVQEGTAQTREHLLLQVLEQQTECSSLVVQAVTDLFERGKIWPVVYKTYPFEDTAKVKDHVVVLPVLISLQNPSSHRQTCPQILHVHVISKDSPCPSLFTNPVLSP